MKCKLLISTIIRRHRLLTNDLVFYSWTASVNDDVLSLWQQTRSSKCRHWGAGGGGWVRTGEQSLDFLHSNYIHPVFTLFELFLLSCGSCSSSPAAVLNKLHTTLGWDVRRGEEEVY